MLTLPKSAVPLTSQIVLCMLTCELFGVTSSLSLAYSIVNGYVYNFSIIDKYGEIWKFLQNFPNGILHRRRCKYFGKFKRKQSNKKNIKYKSCRWLWLRRDPSQSLWRETLAVGKQLSSNILQRLVKHFLKLIKSCNEYRCKHLKKVMKICQR